MDKVRLGIIGIGNIGTGHVENILAGQCPEVEVTAAADRRESRRAWFTEHFPEAAVPKDGPSAGITMCIALISALSGRPVRGDVAMTGEISLRGRVLPIGGLREKLLAAVRAGISTVLLPMKNKDDLFDVPESVRSALDIRFVENADEVLKEALSRQPEMFIPSQAASMAVGENHAAICH